MAVLTQNQDANALNHVVHTVAGFSADPNYPVNLALALVNVDRLSTFLFLAESDNQQLEYVDSNNVTTLLCRGVCRRMELLH